ncbi:MAG: ABC transporter substrate-binding protein [Microthrixaceae bacterium]
MQLSSIRKPWTALAVLLLALSMVAAACGGDSDGGGGDQDEQSEEAGDPTPGGKVVYALEAENSGGWCLAESQLAIVGIQVARAIYDTLTVPDEEANYVPFLADSVEPNAEFTEWTIKVREGVKFHDGSDLTGQVVKNNIDAWRGAYPTREPLLFLFVFDNISGTELVDASTVKVSMKSPWPSFDAYLFMSGRAGIMGQAQLDDTETCDTNLIGTGPFIKTDWKVNESFTAERNPDYWQKDSQGNQLPYLDEIEFRPIIDGDARVNALLGGDINAMHTSGAEQIDALQQEAESGTINLVESDEFPEVNYGMFNMSKAPFDNIKARQAAAYAFDRDTFNTVRNLDLFTMASGPFGPGEIGYLEDAGMPEYNLDKAKELVAEYEAETGQPLEFTITAANDPNATKSVQFLQENASKAGMKVSVKQVEQAALISTTLGGDWQAISWRNHPGGNPDGQYVWWHSTMPTNFGKINDPDLDALLEQGRAETDPAKRQTIYEDVNKIFGEKVYNLWFNWTQWDVATATDVWGVFGPDLPDGSKPFGGLATGHPVSGMWVKQ